MAEIAGGGRRSHRGRRGALLRRIELRTAAIVARDAAARLGCADRMELVPPIAIGRNALPHGPSNVREHLAASPPGHVVFSYRSLPGRATSNGWTNETALSAAPVLQVNRPGTTTAIARSASPRRHRPEPSGCPPTPTASPFNRASRARRRLNRPANRGRASRSGGARRQRVAVACPSFTADCLKPSEIGERARHRLSRRRRRGHR